MGLCVCLVRSSYPSDRLIQYSRRSISHHYTAVSMMTSSNGNIFRVTDPLCGEFTGPGEFPAQRPVTRGFDVFFDLHLNKRLSKQPWDWWFETLSLSLWRHRNDTEPLNTWIPQMLKHIPEPLPYCYKLLYSINCQKQCQSYENSFQIRVQNMRDIAQNISMIRSLIIITGNCL